MPATPERVQQVDLVFKTHLDLGFTDLARNVVQRYFEQYIPGSLALAAKTREEPQRFVWTTASWLVDQYLEQADAAGRRQMEQAITAGDFHWLALPFTTHTELMDGPLFEAGLAISQRLDVRFGRQTIAAKMTDVPGHTRSMVPYLAQAGVRLLHIGINPASAIVRVPPVFRWRCLGEEVVVIYEHDYGKCTRLPGGHALSVNLTGDNLGPQGLVEVRETSRKLQRRFPEAKCQAGSLSQVAERLWGQREQFPIVEAELGDSWIHGTGTDPGKVSRFRALSRLRNQWLAQQELTAGDPVDHALANNLLLTAEHTWGMDIKSHLKDWQNYARPDFEKARTTPHFQLVEASWQEQREYVNGAVAALPANLRTQAEAAFADASPQLTTAWGAGATSTRATQFQLGSFQVSVCPETGALTGLDLPDGRSLASKRSPLGALSYQSFSAADYHRFYRQYNRIEAEWARQDFTKPGLGQEAISGRWSPQLQDVRHTRGKPELLLELGFTGERVTQLGAPPRVLMKWSTAGQDQMDLRLEWLEKPANRMPEALWLHFAPTLPAAAHWEVEKLGLPVDFRTIAKGGSAQLHASTGAVSAGGFSITSLDAPLVAPGPGSLLNFVSRIPRASAGISYNLFNNVWGTNFPMWMEGDAVFRFHLNIPQLTR